MSFQQDAQSGSFHGDNAVTFRLISALAAVTVATSSVLLWRLRRPSPADVTRDPKPAPASSFLRTALASLYPSAPSDLITEEILPDVVQSQGPKGMTSRSKERRRRGKDLFKELSKGGKKHKDLHRQLNRHSATSLGDLNVLQAEQGHSYPELSPVKSEGSSRVQISGPSPSRLNVANNPRTLIDEPPDDAVSRSLAGEFDLSAVTANKERPVQDSLPSHNNEVVSQDGIIATEEPRTLQDRACQTSTDYLAAPSRGLDFHTEGSASSSNISSSSQGRPRSDVTSDSCDWDGQSSFGQESTPHFAAVRATDPQSELAPSIYSPASFSSTDIPSTSSDIFTSLTCPMPALRVGARPMPTSHIPPSLAPNPVSAQTQIASLRGALEAARLREEKSRTEGECRVKEFDSQRRRWMEEIARRHHREAQLHAHIQYLTHVLQMYAGAYPFLSTRTPIVPGLVASPLPGAVHSITMHQSYDPVLNNTRGRRHKREVQEDDVVGNPNVDVLPLCNEVVGAILKRPESLGTGTQLRPPRLPPSDMRHMWYVGGTETEESNKEIGAGAEDGRENEAVREENGYLSWENVPPDDIAGTEITRLREEETQVDQ